MSKEDLEAWKPSEEKMRGKPDRLRLADAYDRSFWVSRDRTEISVGIQDWHHGGLPNEALIELRTELRRELVVAVGPGAIAEHEGPVSVWRSPWAFDRQAPGAPAAAAASRLASCCRSHVS
jgi:hypothetical protein